MRFSAAFDSKRLLLPLSALAILAGAPGAQTLPGGMAMGSWSAGPVLGLNIAGADLSDRTSQHSTGLAVGARLEVGLSPMLLVGIEPKWIQKGAEFAPDSSTFDGRGEFSFLETPLYIKGRLLFGAASIYALVGPALGFRTSVDGQIEAGRVATADDIRLLEFSGEAGVGAGYGITGNLDVTGDLRYSHGFRNLLEHDAGPIDSWYSRDWRLLAGLMYHVP